MGAILMTAPESGMSDHALAENSIYVCELKQCPLNQQQEDLKNLAIELGMAYAKLAVAEKRAQEMVMQYSSLLATMSHEIRTPLNAVVGMSKLLMGTVLSHEQEEYAQTMLFAANALLDVANNILDYSKIESGSLLFEQLDFSIVETMEDAIGLFTAKAWEKRLDITYEIDGNVPESVRGDPARLQQVLSNLLSNAVKFTERGGIHISVRLGKEFGPLQELCFSVRDSGIGIKPKDLERLFKPFSQADASISRRFGGTGLGLIISERLVSFMLGRIWVESVFGSGSTFHFTIGVRKTCKAFPGSAKLGGRNMLIIDSNQLQLSQQAWLCRSFGMNVSTALSLFEAIVSLNARPDVILIDSNAVQGEDAQLAAKIQRLDNNALTPTIVLTADSAARNTVPKNVNIHSYLSKPIRTRVLAKAIEEAISESTLSLKTSSYGLPLDGHTIPKLSVLVADDNAINRKLMLILLNKMGLNSDVAENGLEVLEALSHKHYDLIFMDMHMPHMDGIEVMHQIVKKFGPNRPRVIAVTANASQDDRSLCLDAGMDDYLTKPIVPDRLRQIISASMTAEKKQMRTGSNNGTAYLDPETVAILKEVFQGSPEKLQELLNEFLADAHARIEAISAAIEAHDFATIISIAHKLKGSAAGVGAVALSQLAYRLQSAVPNQEIEAIHGLLSEFRLALISTRKAFHSLIQKLPNMCIHNNAGPTEIKPVPGIAPPAI